MTSTTTRALNTAKSVQNDNGFIIRRFGRYSTYLKATGDGRTIWVDRNNPTVLFSKRTDTWAVYITFDSQRGIEREATAQGFKTHGDAERWANENIK